MQVFNEFASGVARAMTAAKMKPVRDADTEPLCSVMVIVGIPPEPPVAGAVNYVDGKWVVETQLLPVEKVDPRKLR